MIIVGTYPELAESGQERHGLLRLRYEMESVIPADVVIHILPPYPSSGDGGFAPDDWYTVRDGLGTWQDITNWAKTRRLILDGVYNHVGRRHPFVEQFFEVPTESTVIYAYPGLTRPSAQTSPRGGSVFREYSIHGEPWQVWQTFSESSFDIRLTDARVIREIHRHLRFLRASGIYGVRLDGCAYYGHDTNVEQFHNPGGIHLTRVIARLAIEHGLYVVAQLDADPVGASYFPTAEGWSTPVVDYAYSAVLVRALLTESAHAMALHLNRTSALPCAVLRPPRTHDGILLQSDLLSHDEREDLVRISDRWNLPVRMANEEHYEINSSLPFICSLGVDDDMAWRRALLVVALTGIIPGIPYFYAPFLLFDVPELRGTTESDPRALNRGRLSVEHIKQFRNSARFAQMRALLRALQVDRASAARTVDSPITVEVLADSVLAITAEQGASVFACNFSTVKPAVVDFGRDLHLSWGSGATPSMLAPVGFGVWRAGRRHRHRSAQ